jgi:hypothetical protein
VCCPSSNDLVRLIITYIQADGKLVPEVGPAITFDDWVAAFWLNSFKPNTLAQFLPASPCLHCRWPSTYTLSIQFSFTPPILFLNVTIGRVRLKEQGSRGSGARHRYAYPNLFPLSDPVNTSITMPSDDGKHPPKSAICIKKPPPAPNSETSRILVHATPTPPTGLVATPGGTLRWFKRGQAT